MSTRLIMPQATAVWLIDNTKLTFKQIAQFCELHELEIKSIADGDVAKGILGISPLETGQLKKAELKKAEEDENYNMHHAANEYAHVIPPRKVKKYVPISLRQDRPNAIAWIIKYYPELKDSTIIKLLRTTKPTVQAIRERTHWNISEIKPTDPVTLGLCSQTEFNAIVLEEIGTLRSSADTYENTNN